MSESPLLKPLLALASPKRLQIIEVLAGASELLATTTIAQLLDIPPSLCSKHLQNLLEAGLVLRTVSGPFALYALDRQVASQLCSQFCILLIPKERTQNESLGTLSE